jgi:hypothetical protein
MLADPFPSLLYAHSRPIPVPSACTQATEALTWGVDFNEQDRIELFEAERKEVSQHDRIYIYIYTDASTNQPTILPPYSDCRHLLIPSSFTQADDWELDPMDCTTPAEDASKRGQPPRKSGSQPSHDPNPDVPRTPLLWPLIVPPPAPWWHANCGPASIMEVVPVLFNCNPDLPKLLSDRTRACLSTLAELRVTDSTSDVWHGYLCACHE